MTPILLLSRKAHLLEDKQIPIVKDFRTWIAFGGNTRDLGSFGEETDKITTLHQESRRIVQTTRGDGVAIIKRRRQDFHRGGVRDPSTASGHNRLKEDLESSTWRRRHDFKATLINMCKSKIMGANVEDGKIQNAASKLGCLVLKTSFTYL
nr:RNA-directed DNA polymerase, eukaryota [Tanacetum cinerariifolium]